MAGMRARRRLQVCRSPCGERGLKLSGARWHSGTPRRSPCGERGLKCAEAHAPRRRVESLPVRGAWVEIIVCAAIAARALSLPVRGAWVEMSRRRCSISCWSCRSPCGERGLKYKRPKKAYHRLSRSPCGERGLKFALQRLDAIQQRRSPCGERGLKSVVRRSFSCPFRSLPVRGAWVEIRGHGYPSQLWCVAPRAGSVG